MKWTKLLFAMIAVAVVACTRPGCASEPSGVTLPAPAPFAQFSFKQLCVRSSDCGKSMCGIHCWPPAFTCRDDYCAKPLPRVSLCWPKSCCDDYCAKPFPCWPLDPCACRTNPSK